MLFNDGPELYLTITESNVHPVGTILRITPAGLDGSLRQECDGRTLIGDRLEENGKIINDFAFLNTEIDIVEIGRNHAVIKFSTLNRAYRIKDLSEGTGTFVRIINPTPLKEISVISFSDSHMMVNIVEPD
jgi:hypothetical protein